MRKRSIQRRESTPRSKRPGAPALRGVVVFGGLRDRKRGCKRARLRTLMPDIS